MMRSGAGTDVDSIFFRASRTEGVSKHHRERSPRASPALHDLTSERTAAADADITKLMRELVTPLYAFRGRKKGYEVSVMKTMMDLTGQVGGQVRPPLNDLTPAEVKEWRTLIKAWRKWL